MPVAHHGRARAVRLAAAVLAAVSLAGCGVRLDTPPPEVPVADATEEARQGAARESAQLHALAVAARAATDDAATGEVLIAVESAAAEHHAALGGVWEPWPGAGPEATAYPGESPSPSETPDAGEATPQAVLDLLEESAAAARQSALEQSGELGALFAAVAISRDRLAADLAEALGTSVQALTAEPLPLPAPGSLDPETSRTLDAARYALEVVAARSSGDQRTAAAERAAYLAEVAGAVAPEEDIRDVAYDLSVAADSETPERDLAAAAEHDVVRAYVTLLTADDGVDREAVFAAALHAAREVRSWGGALPELPGLS